MRTRSAIALAFAALLVLGALPVAAVQPYSEPFSDGGSEDIDCGSYVVTLQRTYIGIATVFFNQAGDAIRLQFVSTLDGSISREGSESIRLRGGAIVVIDFVRETYTFDGTTLIGTEPGGGVTIQDSGRFQLDFGDNLLQLAGPHDAIELGANAFCQALA
jgi:hypothetical protein